MAKKMLLISNMYPSKKFPDYGTFVSEFVNGMSSLNWDIFKVVLNKRSSKIGKIISYLIFLLCSWFSLNKSTNDVTYIHYASHSSIPLLFSRKQKYLVVNVHGSDVLPNTKLQKKFQFFTRYAVLKADMVVVPSRYFKDIVCSKYGVSKKSIFVSPSGGVDKSFFKKHNKFITGKKTVFGFVGRIEKAKGWNVLLEALRKIPAEKVKCIIVGSGTEQDKLKKKLRNLSDLDITYIGRQGHEQLRNLYPSFDWLIFPSTSESESLGLVGLESMASGTPIIASDIGGIVTYARDNKNSLLFKSGEVDLLVKSINRALGMDYKTWKQYSDESLKTAKKYKHEIVIKNLSDELTMRLDGR